MDDDANERTNKNAFSSQNLITKPEELKMIYLRSFLNKLNKAFQQKDDQTRQCQEEVKNCKQRIANFEKKRDDLYSKIEIAQKENNM
jgi:hypothetical protein